MKSFKNILLIALILVFAAFATVVFLTVPEGRTESPTFWIAWVFAVPVNLIFSVALHLWASKAEGKSLFNIPIAYWLMSVCGVAYISFGIKFMYLAIEQVPIILAIDLVITVLYIILAIFFVFGSGYIYKSEKYTKEKVMFIRMLQADVLDCINKTTNTELKNALNKFAENVRFSDPMSHESLSGIEASISSTVLEISTKIETASTEEILALIKKAQVELDSRNKRCIMLK